MSGLEFPPTAERVHVRTQVELRTLDPLFADAISSRIPACIGICSQITGRQMQLLALHAAFVPDLIRPWSSQIADGWVTNQ